MYRKTLYTLMWICLSVYSTYSFAERYVHGYDEIESLRLLKQGEIVRSSVFNKKVNEIISNSETVFEMGYGSGTNIIYMLRNYKNLTKYRGADIGSKIYQDKIISALSNKEKLKLDLLPTNDFHNDIQIRYDSKNNKQVDLVFSTWVFEHLCDPDSALENAYNLLKNGGYLVITECSWNATKILLNGKEFEEYEHLKKALMNKQNLSCANATYGEKLRYDIFQSRFKDSDYLHFDNYIISEGEFSNFHGQQESMMFILDIMAGTLPKLKEKVQKLRNMIKKNPDQYSSLIKVFQVIARK